MVVPVETDVNESEEIGGEQRHHRHHCRERIFRREFKLQHHDRQDDGDDAVGQSVQAFGLHVATVAANSRGPKRDLSGWTEQMPGRNVETVVNRGRELKLICAGLSLCASGTAYAKDPAPTLSLDPIVARGLLAPIDDAR